MGILYRTHKYLRSHIGAALLEASQFAHVPERAVWGFLDAEREHLARRVRVLWGEHDARPRPYVEVLAYEPEPTLVRFERTFGVLCPLCLCPVQTEGVAEETGTGIDIYGRLYLHRDYSPMRLHPECRDASKTIDTACEAHECGAHARISRQLNRSFFEKISEVFDKYGRPELRFNPRTNDGPSNKRYLAIEMLPFDFPEEDILARHNFVNA